MNYYLPHRHHVQVYRPQGVGEFLGAGGSMLVWAGLGLAAWLAYREFNRPRLLQRAFSRADTAL